MDTAALLLDAPDLDARWARFESWFSGRFGGKVSIEGALFLIGVRERGHGFEPDLGKDEEQDLIMEGTFCAFEALGLYARVGADESGRWLWQRTTPPPKDLDIDAQERLLRLAVVRYFDGVMRSA